MKRAYGAVFALLALTNCNNGGDATQQVNDAQRQVEGAARSLGNSPEARAAQDALLAAGIKAKLVPIDVDAAVDVQVSVHGGIATLRGSAPSSSIRARYVDAVQWTNGVANVRDLLRIDPSKSGRAERTAADLGLDAEIVGAMIAQGGVNALRLKTTTDRGVVTLRGTVASSDVKRTLIAAAHSVGGVRAVIDHVRVSP